MLGSRAKQWALPSLFAGFVTVLVATGLDAVLSTSTLMQALGALGLSLVVGWIPLTVFSLVGRGLGRTWAPFFHAQRAPSHLGAWLLYAVLALGSFSALLFFGVALVLAYTNARIVQQLVLTALAALSALLLVVLAPAAAHALRFFLQQLKWRGKPMCTAGFAIRFPLVLALLAGWLAAMAVAKPLGPVRVEFWPSALAGLFCFIATPIVWQKWSVRARRYVGASALAGAVLLLACAAILTKEPNRLLDMWAKAPLAGFVVETLFDIEDVRENMDLSAIAPRPLPSVKAHPDVVLITIDTLRADMTSVYGGPAKMPNLLRVAERSVVFEYAFSAGNVTRRSLPALATGRAATRVLGRVAGWALRLDPRYIVMGERFLAAGYQTVGFFCCESQFGPRHKLGLSRGFSVLDIDPHSKGKGVTERLSRFLATRTDRRPLFLWVHLLEPHNWDIDFPMKSATNKQRYALSLEATDKLLGNILDALAFEKRQANTVLAITADHAESLGDHGSKTHAATLFNSEVRVPLVVSAPSASARRILQPVGGVDVLPTLLELAGYEPPTFPEVDGESLAPLFRGRGDSSLEAGRAYMVQIANRSVASSLRAVVLGRHKLIVDESNRPIGLFDFVADPGEVRNLSAREPTLLKRLQVELRRRLSMEEEHP